MLLGLNKNERQKTLIFKKKTDNTNGDINYQELVKLFIKFKYDK